MCKYVMDEIAGRTINSKGDLKKPLDLATPLARTLIKSPPEIVSIVWGCVGMQ